jgi:hypothetical protein
MLLAHLAVIASLSGCSDRAAAPGSEERFVALSELWTIGQAEGAGPDLFGEIGGLLVDSLGRVHVLDASAGEVRVFGPEGDPVRTYSGPGSGPGELLGPSGLALHPPDEIWILDVTNNRWSVFDTSGVYRADIRRPASGFSRPWMGGFDGEGRILDVTFRPSPAGAEMILVRAEILRRPDGRPTAIEPADTFALPRPPEDRFIVSEIDRSGRRRQVSVAIPFVAGLRRDLSPPGTVWEARTDRFRLVEYVPGGDTLRRVERDAVAVPVSPGQLDSALAVLGERTSPDLSWDRGRIPSTWPVLAGFFADGARRLFVRPIERSPVLGFDLLEPTGEWVRIRSETRLELEPRPAVRGDTLWAVVRDELGVNRLRKATWDRSPRALGPDGTRVDTPGEGP